MNAILYQTIGGALAVCAFGPWCLNQLADAITFVIDRSDRKARIKHAMSEGNL